MIHTPVSVIVCHPDPGVRRRVVAACERRDSGILTKELAAGTELAPALEAWKPDAVITDAGSWSEELLLRARGKDGVLPVLMLLVPASRDSGSGGRGSRDPRPEGGSGAAVFDRVPVDLEVEPLRERVVGLAAEARRRKEGRFLARRLLSLSASGRRPEEEPEADPADTDRPPPVAVRSEGRRVLLEVDEIRWIEAAGARQKLHTTAGTFPVRRTMEEWAEKLAPHGFRRLHRSCIVDVERIREVRPGGGGAYHVLLRDGTELRISRARTEDVEGLLDELT